MERTDSEMLDWMIASGAKLSKSDTFHDGDNDWICRFYPNRLAGPVMTFGPTSRAAIAKGMLWTDTHLVLVTGTSRTLDLPCSITVTKYCANCVTSEVQQLGEICPACLEILNHEDDDGPCCEEDHRP